MTTIAEKVFCDTNVLLCALDRRRTNHGRALHVLDQLPNSGVVLHVSNQVLRELLAVCTRPTAANGLGLSNRQAVENARAMLAREQAPA